MSLRRVLVANHGENAVRIVRACFDEGVESVAAVSDADRDSLAARRADTVVRIGPAAASASYLDVGSIVGASPPVPGSGRAARWPTRTRPRSRAMTRTSCSCGTPRAPRTCTG